MTRLKAPVAIGVFCAIAFSASTNAAFITADFSGTVLDSTSPIASGTPVTGVFGFEADPVIADTHGSTPGSDYWLAGSGPDFVSYYDSNYLSSDSGGRSITMQFSILGTEYRDLGGFQPTSLTISNAADGQHLALHFDANRAIYTFEIVGPPNSMFGSLDVRSFNPETFSLIGGTGFFGFPSGAAGTSFSFDTVHFNVEPVPEPATLTLLCLGLAALGASTKRRLTSSHNHAR
ncbi:MAG TPA: PEP-CTERM sorting domain-containing protein [Steroidobacter sp.]